MKYSKLPIFDVPAGWIRFWAASALVTSWPDNPSDCNFEGLTSIWI